MVLIVVSDVCLSYSYHMDDEIAKFIRRVNPPRVVIDNEVYKNVTVIKVTLESSLRLGFDF